MKYSDLVGQEHVVSAIAVRLREGRRSALILAGPSASGKTTIARLYASSMLCETRNAAIGPCKGCVGCQRVDEHGSFAYLEMDGRRHDSVDTMQAQRAKFVGSLTSDFLIMVVRNAEFLTPDASDVLLKEIEEDRPVVFIFLVSDLNRASATIRSRCELLVLRRISPELIKQRVQAECAERSIACDVEAASLIAAEADGQIGRAIQILDSVKVKSCAVSVSDVLATVGICEVSVVAGCWLKILNGDIEAARAEARHIGPNYRARTRSFQRFLRAFFSRALQADGGSISVAMYDDIPSALLDALMASWRALANRQGRDLFECVTEAVRFWCQEGATGDWQATFNRTVALVHHRPPQPLIEAS
jgi:DNA polymerase III gamma/tau subunit